jgi:hypothetical protein
MLLPENKQSAAFWIKFNFFDFSTNMDVCIFLLYSYFASIQLQNTQYTVSVFILHLPLILKHLEWFRLA